MQGSVQIKLGIYMLPIKTFRSKNQDQDHDQFWSCTHTEHVR